MERNSTRQNNALIQLYIQNNFSNVKTICAFPKTNIVKSAPADNTIRHLYAKFVNASSPRNVSHYPDEQDVPMKISKPYEPVLKRLHQHPVVSVLKS
ncbi:unnamed protein product [Acanthoscelides obtectus]|uniref:Uncharacterized protein n=1 Tax=Acanthoscelides obtectus TaxID=200917 RepID=A0A9P0PHQ3_ACAOB|nr:unnamed protein product [Acanthoscelides obtectus]CAK1653520.1 hypothetical protein AOBTE_LOCUS18272 [Acanthoscelides obtectus]